MKQDELQHFGVLGMKWGRRNVKASTISADHARVKDIRKKKLKDMTDDEIKAVTKRAGLVLDYKKDKFYIGGKKKKIKEMSNDELAKGIVRGKLSRADWRYGVPRKKRIKEMSDEEVKKTLDRYLLEKSYKDLRNKELEPARQIAMYFLQKGIRIAIPMIKNR